MTIRFPELGIYTLPGRVNDSERALQEIPEAESLGLGSVWLGERYDYKNAGVICGAGAALTSEIKIATGLVNYPTHHPMELCSLGATMSQLSANRFAMGIGRGFDELYDCFGTSRANLKGLEQITDILRKLWNEGSYSGENSIGKFPYLFVAEPPNNPPPLLLGALGDRTLELGGRCYDGVMLHPYISDETVARQVQIVRSAAERAGRDPTSVKVWSCMVCAADQSAEETAAIGPARLLTYVQGTKLGDQIFRANGWDPAILEKIKNHPLFENGRTADQDFSRYETEQVAALLPEQWLATTSALGSAAHCAQRLVDHINAGADGIVIHGSVPKQVGSLLNAYEEIRDGQHIADNPPWMKPSPTGTGIVQR